jgi:small subunit ribosomal protein S8
MTLMDPIGDMFTRMRNGQLRLLSKVEMPSSKFRLKILEVLKSEGFITSYHIEKK